MKGITLLATVLLAPLLLTACSEDNGGAGAAAASSSSGGEPAAPIAWKPLPTEGAPQARHRHTAVWTGSKMIIWGGLTGGTSPVTATGGVYDPAARTWTPTSTQGAPEARHSHTAVWTGSKMIIWGGYGEKALAAEGALYDPSTNTWTPMSKSGQPAPRITHSVVWTGNSLILWGGDADKPVATGGIYDPAADTWITVSTDGAPSARFSHSAVWTGSKMIVWGGYNYADWLNNGALFDPAGGSGGAWVGSTASEGAPTFREGHTGVWSGSSMLIWGGWTGGPYENTGGIFDPGASGGGTWTAMSKSGAPSPRAEHTGVWTGSELILWGGCGEDACGKVYGDGARFTPGSDGGRFTPIEEQDDLSPRRGHTGVATGSSIILWGGRVGSNEVLDTGAESAL